MLIIQGIDFNLPQINKEPKMGYEQEYIEKKMVSGKIRRIHKGKRFVATFSFAFLTGDQKASLQGVMEHQRIHGYVTAQIQTPFGSFNGNVNVELGSEQTRFKYDKTAQDYVWTDWQIVLRGTDLV